MINRLTGLSIQTFTGWVYWKWDADEASVVACSFDDAVKVKLPYSEEFTRGLADIYIQDNHDVTLAAILAYDEFSQDLCKLVTKQFPQLDFADSEREFEHVAAADEFKDIKFAQGACLGQTALDAASPSSATSADFAAMIAQAGAVPAAAVKVLGPSVTAPVASPSVFIPFSFRRSCRSEGATVCTAPLRARRALSSHCHVGLCW